MTSVLRNSTNRGDKYYLLAAIVTLALSTTGCQTSAIAMGEAWSILVGGNSDSISFVSLSPEQAYASKAVENVRCMKTVARCTGAWHNPAAKLVATREVDGQGYAIRLYDANLRLLGEHKLTSASSDARIGRPSKPTVGDNGLVAFVDSDEVLSVAHLAGANIAVKQVGSIKLRDSWRDQILWSSEREIAYQANDGVRIIDVSSGNNSLITRGALLGVVKGRLCILAADKQLLLVDPHELTPEAFCPTIPQLALPWYRTYAGLNIARVSHSGQFFLYDSTSFWGTPVVVLRDIPSGREVELVKSRFADAMWCGSWNDVSP